MQTALKMCAGKMVSNIREVSDFELMLQKQVEAVFKKRVSCISIKILSENFLVLLD